MKVKFFDDKIENFINSLEESVIGRILRTIDLLEMFGNKLGLPHAKKVETRLFELRVHGKQEVRILYTFHGDAAILLHGFIKKSQRIPRKEIEVARHKLRTFDGQ
jgi:hypothetical protein